MHWRIFIFIIGVLWVAQPAWALRCGNKLIAEGAPQSKVLRYCGEPESIRTRRIYRTGLPRRQIRLRTGDTIVTAGRDLLLADRAYVEIQVEEWTYNFGPRRLMRQIRFENGIVTRISQLGYGYH